MTDSPNGVLVEVGPVMVRGPGTAAAESAETALECVDDAVALCDDEPVTVAGLWREVLRAAAGGYTDALVLVVPSWWPGSRMECVRTAARSVSPDVTVLCRGQVLGAGLGTPWAVVEIADEVIAVSRAGSAPVVLARSGDGDERAVAAAAASSAEVVIDAPPEVGGAGALGSAVADRMRGAGATVTFADDGLLRRAAANLTAPQRPRVDPGASPVARPRYRGLATLGAVSVAALCGGVALWPTGAAAPASVNPATIPTTMPMTLLVEGRMGVQVPALWAVRRVTDGPGSARLQVVSPADSQAALHITQSVVPAGQTPSAAADTLRRAFEAQPDGVFVDFNPDDHTAQHTVISYREVRADHHIRWAVLIDKDVRIAIGCQSAPDRGETVRLACEAAIRSAHAVF